MDLLILLAWIGAIGAVITIRGACMNWRKGRVENHVENIGGWSALRKAVILHAKHELTLPNSHPIEGRLADLFTINDLLKYIEHEESTPYKNSALLDTLWAALNSQIEIENHRRSKMPMVPENPVPIYFQRLTSGLPPELHPYREEIAAFVEEGVKDRVTAGKPSKPYVLSQSLHICTTILKARFRLSIIRRRSIK